MSTQAERHSRATRHILPIKISVKQADGRNNVQHVDADVRQHPIALKYEEEAACTIVRRALNAYYYGES